jgi:anaerobic carbon-monoxide dehydrogenase iron sulfur subunit
MPQTRIRANEDACIGCHLCEVYCLTEHSRSRSIVKAHLREQPRAQARVHVEEERPGSVAIQCHQCSEPLCVAACLTGAMQKDPETGIVTSDSDRCMGCWTCIMVCPYGALTRDATHNVIVKCDLCSHLVTPACVANCPNEALTLERS